MSGDIDPVHRAQRRHLRRIMLVFALVLPLLPLAVLGRSFSWLFLPLVAASAVALWEALRLRRSVRLHGARHVR